MSRPFASLSSGTLKPAKSIDAFDVGPPVVSRVIAIDNAVLRQQFKSAMDRMEAKGGGSWGGDDDLQVLRMSVPDIAGYLTLSLSLPSSDRINPCIALTVICRYSHARPALLFHATHDVSEKGICCLGFRKEFQGSASGVNGMIGKGVYFSTLPM